MLSAGYRIHSFTHLLSAFPHKSVGWIIEIHDDDEDACREGCQEERPGAQSQGLRRSESTEV